MAYDQTKLKEKVTTIDIQTSKNIEDLKLDFIFDYHIFPNNLMSFKTQWTQENRKMKVGDTILQQIYFPPTKRFSQKIIFGVRISEIIEEPDRKGFSYVTIEGHAENGIATFTVEELADNIIFKIRTYSTPGNKLTKILGPIFTTPYQTFCTKSALKHVKYQLERQ